jgi:hypothetical protein
MVLSTSVLSAAFGSLWLAVTCMLALAVPLAVGCTSIVTHAV